MNTHNILQMVEHRPFPLPQTPWIMTQIWHELLFAHWPVDPALLRPLIPATLTLDTFDGQAWVAVVPFRMTYVRPRAVPKVPWLSRFVELNVRTYVTVNGVPGVYFFSLDASNSVAVSLARSLFFLPYYHAAMNCTCLPDGTIRYRSRRIHRGVPSANFAASYRPTSPMITYHPRHTLEYWFTERYCLYAVSSRQHVYRCDIHHSPWPLQPAEWDVTCNTMAQAAGITLPDTAPSLYYSDRQEVLIWPPYRVV